MTIAAIVQLITDFILNLIKKWKLQGLQKEAEKAKEKANESLEKERTDFDDFMHDMAEHESGPSDSVKLRTPVETLRDSSSGAAKNNRRPGRPKRKAGSSNKRARVPAKGRKKSSKQ